MVTRKDLVNAQAAVDLALNIIEDKRGEDPESSYPAIYESLTKVFEMLEDEIRVRD